MSEGDDKADATVPPAPITFRQATDDDRAAIETLQHAAYARNRALIGVTPLPLKEDYAEIMRSPEREVWLAEERGRLKGVLILQKRPNDLLIWSVAAAKLTFSTPFGTTNAAGAIPRYCPAAIDPAPARLIVVYVLLSAPLTSATA